MTGLWNPTGEWSRLEHCFEAYFDAAVLRDQQQAAPGRRLRMSELGQRRCSAGPG